MKWLSEVTDQQCYEISVLEGWKNVWEHDRGGKGTVEDEELIERGRDIVEGEIQRPWVNIRRVNVYLSKHGYESIIVP